MYAISVPTRATPMEITETGTMPFAMAAAKSPAESVACPAMEWRMRSPV